MKNAVFYMWDVTVVIKTLLLNFCTKGKFCVCFEVHMPVMEHSRHVPSEHLPLVQ